MPEGDTIFRTAESLRRWIGGREVTAARSRAGTAPVPRVIGTTVERVEARGKHLLIEFSNGDILHTHMRMTGAWHVYPTGERWRRPAATARVVLECGDRVAVCFDAPVVELLRPGGDRAHPALASLGPDLLDPAFDPAIAVRRARQRSGERAVAELLLDQRVAAGIGNIYRSEALFLCGIDPFTPVVALDDERLERLYRVAAGLLRANATLGTTFDRETGGGAGRPWVYGRRGRLCRRCGTPIRAMALGEQARTVSWCPTCQPPG
jgi:endonuclease-8